MSYFDDRTDKDLSNPVHGQGTPGNDARRRSYELNDKYAGKDNTPSEENKPPEEDYSLNDDRRVKVLSPGTLVAKRFFRNRLAVVGLTILAVMFIFSFIGGLISPYGQDEVFYRDDIQLKEYAAMSENTEYRYLVADGQEFGTILQAQLTLHMGKDDSFSYKGVTYDVTKEGDSLYSVSSGGLQPVRRAHQHAARPGGDRRYDRLRARPRHGRHGARQRRSGVHGRRQDLYA